MKVKTVTFNLISAFIGGIFFLSLISCGKKKEAPRQRPLVPVMVAAAGQKTMPVRLSAIGNVEPFATVAVKSQVSGTVLRVHFSEGRDVKKGEILFTIDPRPFESALKQAEAILAKDMAQAKNAEVQAQRYAALVNEGIVTREQYDQLRTAAEAYNATAAADRAAVENAKIQLGYCTIRSPLTGRTGNLAVNAGNVVKANENPALVNINQISPVYVSFGVPEKELPEVKRRLGGGKLSVEAFIPAEKQLVESGTVSFLDNTVDPTTGMIKLKGTFANKSRRLWPGQFVNVVLTLSTLPNAVVVPQQAVQTGQKGQYVFVVKDDRSVEQRAIAVGISNGGETVIEKGLNPGEVVVTDGQMRLMPGAKVEIKQPGQVNSRDSSGQPAAK